MSNALVIDDNRQTADTLCRMLDLLGVQAQAAYGPRAAILGVRESAVDIIFLDINMPGVDGFEVLSFLRRAPKFQDIPVVMVTSDDQPETATRARETGALTLILKPVTVEALEKVLKQTKMIP